MADVRAPTPTTFQLERAVHTSAHTSRPITSSPPTARGCPLTPGRRSPAVPDGTDLARAANGRSGLRQVSMHDMETDETVHGVVERVRNRGKNLEPD